MNLHGKLWMRWESVPPPNNTEIYGLDAAGHLLRGFSSRHSPPAYKEHSLPDNLLDPRPVWWAFALDADANSAMNNEVVQHEEAQRIHAAHARYIAPAVPVGIFVAELQAQVIAIHYDFASCIGTIDMDAISCTDMTGAIRLFERIDSNVVAIYTRAGNSRDTTYRRNGDGMWSSERGQTP